MDTSMAYQCHYSAVCNIMLFWTVLTHRGRVAHICVAYLTIIASDNGLSPSRRQAIISTNAGILLIGSLGTNFNEILIEIHTFSLKKIYLKMSSGECRPFCLGLNELKQHPTVYYVVCYLSYQTQLVNTLRPRQNFLEWKCVNFA